ncbi:MAG: hypothetical protein WBD55_01020 [Dehalococcoidia bacterium]
MEFGGSANLQSGFVLAVILLAVFFADRIGGSERLAMRVYQVALGVLLAFLVISSTTAFVRPPDAPPSVTSQLFDSSGGDGSGDGSEEADFFVDTTRRNAIVTTIHAGLGIVFASLGLAMLRSWRTLSLGVLLAGLLLILFGGVQGASASNDPVTLLFSFYSSALGGAFGVVGQARDIAHFAVLLVGTGALAAFGFWRWDRRGAPEPVAAT